MTFRLPDALRSSSDADACGLLTCYYAPGWGSSEAFTGAAFDDWDSTGTRTADINRFTADDLVAVTFLSVNVHPRTAYVLLHERPGHFSDLLTAVGPDRELADQPDLVEPTGAARTLYSEVLGLTGTGVTTATKLCARKRPRLIPIWDSIIGKVIGVERNDPQWEPLRAALQHHNGALNDRLLWIRDQAGLPTHISVLRVFDVICWMEGGGPSASRTSRRRSTVGIDSHSTTFRGEGAASPPPS